MRLAFFSATICVASMSSVVACVVVLPQQSTKDACRVHAFQAAEPLLSLSLALNACAPMRRSQSPRRRCSACLELNKSAQPFVVPQNAQILQRPPPPASMRINGRT